MIGAIYGDIAGSKYEFSNIRTKEFELLSKDCYFTDDTVCTIAFMDFLMNAKVRNEEEATKYLRKWTRNYPGKGYGGHFASWIYSDNPKPYGSYGNGSAMRISSVAYVAKDLDELKNLSDTVTIITHNAKEGMKGALVIATCIFMALHGKNKEDIKKYAISKYPEIETFDYETLRKTYGFYEICQMSVPQAIYCFLISKDFKDCAKTTISIGGDCDTTAAMSCAIAEAYYGISEEDEEKAKSFLPKEMVEIIDKFEKYVKKEELI